MRLPTFRAAIRTLERSPFARAAALAAALALAGVAAEMAKSVPPRTVTAAKAASPVSAGRGDGAADSGAARPGRSAPSR